MTLTRQHADGVSTVAVSPVAGAMTVIKPGLQTTVQELPGRTGYWAVGVPPSGAWDDLGASLANRAVGNPPGTAGLEILMQGPTLLAHVDLLVCLTGAAAGATAAGAPLVAGVPTAVPAGELITVGRCGPHGIRAFLAVAGGIEVPVVLGSRATFLLGGFGGVRGRALRVDDVLAIGVDAPSPPVSVASLLPTLGRDWQLRVVRGPHGSPEHLTPQGVSEFFAATWIVDHRADRTGVRLQGPRPDWARADGGDAGLHPSNLHDSAYPVGGVMLSGDTPVIVGPDGPSLGGFVVVCVVIAADQWKLAQLRPGDAVSFVSVTTAAADLATVERERLIHELTPHESAASPAIGEQPGPLAQLAPGGHHPGLTIRFAGERHLLLEAGPAVLDLGVRLWIHLLAAALAGTADDSIEEMVEGVRSLLVKIDPKRLTLQAVSDTLVSLAADLPDPETVVLDVRDVTLPLALDDPAAHEAVARYAASVRADAPWCPDNVEFIRRINDLDARDDVFDVVTAATYLVVGLGDVYLGAPVAVPLDPRHRLVTTKYDPPRTWTPENAVGIGGVYLCVYGMEGPGGYQLLGRTVPVWRLLADRRELPWLLRPFDRLHFVPVSPEELLRQRAEIAAGTRDLDVTPATFRLSEVRKLETEHAAEIEVFTRRRRAGFDTERSRWRA